MSGIRTRNRCFLVVVLVIAVALVMIPTPAQAQTPAGTAFTYQGRLTDSGSVVDGACDFTFKLYDVPGSGEPPAGGTQIGSTVAHNDVQVDSGYFTVDLDFGADAFSGDARYLEIAVDCGEGIYTLGPRQELKPNPYSVFSEGSSPRVSFHVYLSSDFEPYEDLQIVPFSVEEHDEGNNFDTNTHGFVAPNDGTYHFDMGVKARNLGQDFAYIALYRNGLCEADVLLVIDGPYYTRSSTLAVTLRLDMGDSIDVRVRALGCEIVSQHYGPTTWFSGHQIY